MQCTQVCQVLGTPDKQVWPDGYKLAQTRRVKFPEYPRTSLDKMMPHASGEAIEVMDGLMMWNPDHRLTAQQCLAHKYFVNGGSRPRCRAACSWVRMRVPVVCGRLERRWRCRGGGRVAGAQAMATSGASPAASCRRIRRSRAGPLFAPVPRL